MPARRVHVLCGYKLLRRLGVDAPAGIVESIETLIDHPSRARGLLARARDLLCSSGDRRACGLLEARLSGFHVRGVARHDWNSRAGRWLLRRVIESLWGPEYSILADLHVALDCLEQGRGCEGASKSVVEWAVKWCRGLVSRVGGGGFAG